MLAWHFLPADRKLRFPPYTPVVVGETLTATGPLELCSNGMHASWRAIDAMNYTAGPIACRVRLAGEMLHGHDKTCARHRDCLAMVDATILLQEFVCDCTEMYMKKRQFRPDNWQPALNAKRQWLRGGITDSELKQFRVTNFLTRDATLIPNGVNTKITAENIAFWVINDLVSYGESRNDLNHLLEDRLFQAMGLSRESHVR
jgi:hypothetical protein